MKKMDFPVIREESMNNDCIKSSIWQLQTIRLPKERFPKLQKMFLSLPLVQITNSSAIPFPIN